MKKFTEDELEQAIILMRNKLYSHNYSARGEIL